MRALATRPADLKHRVTVQKVGYTRTGIGEAQEAFSNWKANIWAGIETLMGRELFAAQQLQESVTHAVTMYYDDVPTIDNTMWIVYGARRFDIKWVPILTPDERPMHIQVLCRELVGAPGAPDQP